MSRLLTLGLAVFLWVKGINTGAVFYYLSATGITFGFLFLIGYHRKLNRKSELSQVLLRLNENELSALKGDFSHFGKGTEFLDIHHEFTYDLDIFGEKSLFQYINRCCTFHGEVVLAKKFIHSPLSMEKIMESQKIFTEISQKPEFMQDFRSHGLLNKDNPGDREDLLTWSKGEGYREGKFMKILRGLIPALNLGILISGFFYPPAFNFLWFTLAFCMVRLWQPYQENKPIPLDDNQETGDH